MAKLLVVDDEIEICEFLKGFFQDRGYQVTTARSGEEAIAAIERERPDLMLLDIKMPGKDGIEVLREVKGRYPAVRVIMVTALETSEKIDQALRLGADNYTTKPLSLDYLEQDVREKVESLTS